MGNETPTNPSFPIPASIVVVTGKEPYPKWADPDGTGVPLWNRKGVRNALAGVLFRGIALFFPKSPWALFLQHNEADIQMWIDKGAQ